MLFKVEEINKVQMFGIEECIAGGKWPVSIVSAQNNTHLYMIAW